MHTGFADCVGTMIAGSIEDPPKLLEKALSPPAGDASLYLVGRRIPAPEAAWINGAAAHALDYDDVALRGHPSAVLVPAILAEAESLKATGAQMATAYAAGYEVWADLQRRDPDQHHEKGWHPTGIFGAIGAAAACASLRGLDPETATQAIALGASQSAGLVSNFGTMTKPFHAGKSAHAGIIAARLAAAGFTSSPDALEHPLGFLAAVSPKGNVDRTSPTQAGRDWNILTQGLSVKKYPLCYCTHRAIDGVLDLLARQEGRPRRYQGRHRLDQPPQHQGAAQQPAADRARGQVQHAVRHGERDCRPPRRPHRAHRRVRAEARRSRRCSPRSRWCPTTARTRSGWVRAPYDTVVIETNDGRRLESARVTLERGSPELPLSPEELWVKFEACFAIGNPRLDVTLDLRRPDVDRAPARRLRLHQPAQGGLICIPGRRALARRAGNLLGRRGRQDPGSARSRAPAGDAPFERFADSLWITLDDFEVGERGLVGVAAALLPIAQRADGNAEGCRELLLVEPDNPADVLGERHPPHSFELLVGKRLRIGVALGRGLSLLFHHGVEARPVCGLAGQRPLAPVGADLVPAAAPKAPPDQSTLALHAWSLCAPR